MRTRSKLLAAFAASSLVLAACGDDDDSAAETTAAPEEEAPAEDEPAEEEAPAEDEPAEEAPAEDEDDMADDDMNEELSGTIVLDGSSTVGPLSEVAAELFMNENPEVRVTVAQSGTGGGFAKFCIGETAMNNASRPIRDDEAALCEENGIAYDQVEVANDALALLVNNDNPTDCLATEQATQIWDEGSTVGSWGEIDGAEAGDFADQGLTLYGPGTDSGTFDFFTEEINGEGGRIRTDYNDIGEDDFAAVQGIISDVGAMGFVPYSYFQEVEGDVKPLAVDDGNGCTEATLENVQAGTYTPLGRPLFVYASGSALSNPEVKAFMEFYVNNSDQIATAATFIPMTDEQSAEQLDKIAALVGG